MKADKAIRLLKTVEPLVVEHISSVVPNISNPANKGWRLVSATAGATYSLALCEWSDTIDIAGLAANDISLINAGGAVGRPISPFSLIPANASVAQMTIVSVNPIELTASDMYEANGLDVEGNLQDYFLASTQEFQKAADSVYLYTKSGEHNFGTGGLAQATKLYVKSFVASYASEPLGTPAGNVNIPPCTIAIAGITAELDPVAMAAAIYRANDQE
jgi:hypothetical protein